MEVEIKHSNSQSVALFYFTYRQQSAFLKAVHAVGRRKNAMKNVPAVFYPREASNAHVTQILLLRAATPISVLRMRGKHRDSKRAELLCTARHGVHDRTAREQRARDCLYCLRLQHSHSLAHGTTYSSGIAVFPAGRGIPIPPRTTSTTTRNPREQQRG